MPWFNRWKTITETLTLSLARIPFWCFSLSPRTQVVGSYKRRFNSIWKGKKPQRATFHAHIRIHLYFDERITSIKSCLFLNSVRYLHLKYRHTHIQSVTLNWKDIFEAIEGEWIQRGWNSTKNFNSLRFACKMGEHILRMFKLTKKWGSYAEFTENRIQIEIKFSLIEIRNFLLRSPLNGNYWNDLKVWGECNECTIIRILNSNCAINCLKIS